MLNIFLKCSVIIKGLGYSFSFSLNLYSAESLEAYKSDKALPKVLTHHH